MAALQASVDATKKAREGDRPVSVDEARAKGAAKPSRSKTTKAPAAEEKPARSTARRATKGAAAEKEREEAEAQPAARRRKSA
jgi:hypothetical protein